MKKHLLPILFLLSLASVGESRAQGHFVLSGQALNVPEGERTFSLAVTHPYQNEGHTVSLHADGTFEQAIPLQGSLQDVYLYLGDAVTVFTYPGDTIRLEFDYKDLPGSICLQGTSIERTRDLELCMEVYRQFRKRFLNLNTLYYKTTGDATLADSLAHEAVGYTQDMQHTIAAYKQTHGAPLHEDYFYAAAYYPSMGLLANHPALLKKASSQVSLYPEQKRTFLPPYTQPDYDFFAHPEALDFAGRYLQANIRQASESFVLPVNERPFAQAAIAQAIIPNPKLRDWFLVAHVFNRTFMFMSTRSAQALGKHLQGCLTDADAKAALQRVSDEWITPFLPGSEARDMTLVDLEGKEVSLRSLRGKYVYMDIWAVGCGACYNEFRRVDKLHKKYEAYKDRIAYVYVCAQGKADQWKKLVAQYNLQDKGIHLFADPAHADEVKKYDRSMWPTYVLIDPEGKIIEYNTQRPSELLAPAANVLDQVLGRTPTDKE